MEQVATCFHHTDVETGRTCTRCGRPACPTCLRQASVGSHCFECVKQAAPSRREQARVRAALGQRQPMMTFALLAINVVVFFVTRDFDGGSGRLSSEVSLDAGTNGIPIAELGEWWRILSGGFLHADLRHVAFNVIMLFLLGRRFEQSVGPMLFGAVYFASLLAGSAGALLLEPASTTVGASGAIYGLMGALFVVERMSGGDPFNDGIGSLIIINVVISFLIPNISIGGHLGGLVGGALVGAAIGDRRAGSPVPRIAAGALGVAAISVVVALYAAGQWVDDCPRCGVLFGI